MARAALSPRRATESATLSLSSRLNRSGRAKMGRTRFADPPHREVVDVSAVWLRSLHRNPDESGGHPEGHLDGQIRSCANNR